MKGPFSRVSQCRQAATLPGDSCGILSPPSLPAPPSGICLLRVSAWLQALGTGIQMRNCLVMSSGEAALDPLQGRQGLENWGLEESAGGGGASLCLAE